MRCKCQTEIRHRRPAFFQTVETGCVQLLVEEDQGCGTQLMGGEGTAQCLRLSSCHCCRPQPLATYLLRTAFYFKKGLPLLLVESFMRILECEFYPRIVQHFSSPSTVLQHQPQLQLPEPEEKFNNIQRGKWSDN